MSHLNIPRSWAQVPFGRFVKAIDFLETPEIYYQQILGVPLTEVPAYLIPQIAFAQHLPETSPVDKFVFEGKTYVVTSVAELTLGHIMDIERWQKTFEGHKAIPFIIATLFHLETETSYADYCEKIPSRARMFETLPTTIVFSLLDFWFSLFCGILLFFA